eukprot:TRINITY_DN3462_c0_g5_i1.p2 TRINITY_DN3462_c0_g5~~TRINITY_DN3462_c0_g5_i1.p2  ORF type:complete len:262 (-),score=30.67 TRINITY_DN3462_c0_g5_i1:277-1062(-)
MNTTIIRDKDNHTAFVILQREPVNALDLQTWQQLLQCLVSLEEDKSIESVIFMTGLKRDVFTAGNDLKELYEPTTSQARYEQFWQVQNEFLSRLYASRLFTVAAVRGACPAGGCVIALCCDYRILSTISTIGLNEVALGIPVPKYWGEVMGRIIGHGRAEKLLLSAKMCKAKEAVALGLVDEVIDKDNLKQRALEVVMQFNKLPRSGWYATKKTLKEKLAEEWNASSYDEAKKAWKLLAEPRTVDELGKVIYRLSNKQAKL